MSRFGATQEIGWKSQVAAPPGVGWSKRLSDGTIVRLRPIDKQDVELELDFLTRLSPEMRSLRFLGLVCDPCIDVARKLTDLDPADAAGFIALVSDEGRDRQIGAAHLHANPDGDRCDFSVTVSDEWQRLGIGSSLMRILIAEAKARGIRHLQTVAPAHSDGSHYLATRLGFQRRLDPQDPAVDIYHLSLR